MSQPNFYGADFGFDSSNSSSTLTLKFDDCEAITESPVNSASEAYAEQYNTNSSSTTAMMDHLKDNPVLTTASMPIPTRNANAGSNTLNLMNQNSRMNLDYTLDYDLSQDMNMPQVLLMDGSDLNDDGSPTLFALNHNSQYGGNGDSSGENISMMTSTVDQMNVSRASVVPSMSGNGSLGHQLHQQQQQQQQQQQHLLATTTAGHQMWGSDTTTNLISSTVTGNSFVTKAEPFNLDDDAIFQVDKADLLQGTHFNDDPFLDISLDDIIQQDENTLLDDHHSLQTLQNVISPLNSCTISPSGYSSGGGIAVPHQNYHHMHQQQQQQQQQQQLMQPQQNLPVHSPPESVSLYETLNRSPYSLSSGGPIVSPPTPTNSLTNHFQSLNAIVSPRARPIAVSQPNASSGAAQLAIRKYKTNAANQHTKRSALHDLLRKEPGAVGGGDSAAMLGQSVPGGSGGAGGYVSQQGSMAAMAHRNRLAQYHHLHSGQQQMSRLSTSAPTQLGMDQLWQRREPRPHLLSTSSVAEAGSTSSLSTGGVLSPEAPDFSQDEAYSDDSDHYDDFSSDDDSDDEQKFSKSLGSTGSGPGGRKMSKSERYFWQYNVQAKGPKGQRLVIKTEMEDPHVLNEATDPVFSPNCSVRGIKHSGKARKGDGNDLTPNPRKLNSIGRELDKLCRIINDITPVSELPFNARTKTRKEKNKLASRACRLKKKAQHEANKIKLYGLEVEHKRLLSGIANTKAIITSLSTNPYNREGQDEVAQQIERLYQGATKIKIAGMSTEYVNQILEKVKGTGIGGLGGGEPRTVVDI